MTVKLPREVSVKAAAKKSLEDKAGASIVTDPLAALSVNNTSFVPPTSSL